MWGKKRSMACKDKKNSRQTVCYKMAELLYSIFLALKKNFLQNSCAQKILIRELCQKKCYGSISSYLPPIVEYEPFCDNSHTVICVSNSWNPAYFDSCKWCKLDWGISARSKHNCHLFMLMNQIMKLALEWWKME